MITDEVGEYLCDEIQTRTGYTLIGSHLDSVIEGGRYDGVAGVMAGLMVMRWAKEGWNQDPASGRGGSGVRSPVILGAVRSVVD